MCTLGAFFPGELNNKKQQAHSARTNVTYMSYMYLNAAFDVQLIQSKSLAKFDSMC